jgi:hypothetical protein
MKKPRKSVKAPATGNADMSPAQSTPEEVLQGPPARETVVFRTDRERDAEKDLRVHTSSSPRLAGGDVDADWRRADSIGEEAPGGTVATPDQNVVDDLGDALGVSRAPDEEFRPSAEILEARDRDRWRQKRG